MEEKGFDLVTDEVLVCGKYTGEFNGRPYFKLVLGGMRWETRVSCTQDVFNAVKENTSYQFEGHYNVFNDNCSLKFTGILPVK